MPYEVGHTQICFVVTTSVVFWRARTTKGGAWRTRKQVARFLKQGQTGPNFANSGPTRSKTGPNFADSGQNSADSAESYADSAESYVNSEPYLRKTGQNFADSGPNSADSGPNFANSGQKRGASDDYLRVRHFPPKVVTTGSIYITSLHRRLAAG